MHTCPVCETCNFLLVYTSYTLSSPQICMTSPFSTACFFMRRSYTAFRWVPQSRQKDQNWSVLREGICLTLLTYGQSPPRRSPVRTFTKHWLQKNTTQNASPYALKMYTMLYVPANPLTFSTSYLPYIWTERSCLSFSCESLLTNLPGGVSKMLKAAHDVQMSYTGICQCSPEEPEASIVLMSDVNGLVSLPSQSSHLQHKGKLSFFSLDEVLRYSCIDLWWTPGTCPFNNTSHVLLFFISLCAANIRLQRATEHHYQIRRAWQVASSPANKTTIKSDTGY